MSFNEFEDKVQAFVSDKSGVDFKRSKHEDGGLEVSMETDKRLGSICIWPNWYADTCFYDIESGDEIVNTHKDCRDSACAMEHLAQKMELFNHG